MDAPMPLEAPVTIATFPASFPFPLLLELMADLLNLLPNVLYRSVKNSSVLQRGSSRFCAMRYNRRLHGHLRLRIGSAAATDKPRRLCFYLSIVSTARNR